MKQKVATHKDDQGNVVFEEINTEPVINTYQVIERKGRLPYTVMWIGLHRLPSVAHFTTLVDAKAKEAYLKDLGREPAILLDVNQMELVESVCPHCKGTKEGFALGMRLPCECQFKK